MFDNTDMCRPNGAVCDKGNFSKLNKTKYKFLALPFIRFGGVLGWGGGECSSCNS